MVSGPAFYSVAAAAAVGAAMYYEWSPSPDHRRMMVGASGIAACGVLGVLPGSMASAWAWFLRLPRDVPWGVFGGRPFNYDRITDTVILGRLPRNAADLDVLKDKEGVAAIITLNEPWELLLTPEQVAAKGFKALYTPAADFGAPSMASIIEGVAFIESMIADGKTVYIHCNGGKGRSTVMVLAYLMHSRGMTKDEAYDFVKDKRKIAKMRRLGGIMPQWRAVTAYETYLKQSQ